MTLSGRISSGYGDDVKVPTDTLISWDLRGVNNTTPGLKARCFNSQGTTDKFWADSLWYQSLPSLYFHKVWNNVRLG